MCPRPTALQSCRGLEYYLSPHSIEKRFVSRAGPGVMRLRCRCSKNYPGSVIAIFGVCPGDSRGGCFGCMLWLSIETFWDPTLVP